MYNMENSIDVKFWIELETTVDKMNEFTKSEDYSLVVDILKKYSINATIRSEVKPKHYTYNMSGSIKLYTFSIEGIEGIVNIVAYTVTDAENTIKEWLNPGVEVKLLHKDKVTLGKEYRELNKTLNV